MTTKTIGVIGAGAWGTALAALMCRAGHKTRIWAFEKACVTAINSEHINTLYLPDVSLPPELEATQDMADLAGSDMVLMVGPAQHMRGLMQSFAPHHHKGQPIILCSKGIETGSLSLMSDILSDLMPNALPVVLSGPSFAIDVAQGLPTAVTLACADSVKGAEIAQIIQTPTFRPYVATDIIGAEIGGAIKNVLAIACGIVLGLGLGRSAHAALIARGFAEMTRLGQAMGADPQTLTGLCGLGDLVLTCSSQQSRNMSCGYALGQGVDLQTYLAERNVVVEGAASAPAVLALSRRHNVDMPICASVAAIVAGEMTAKQAVMTLLQRPLKSEQA